MANKGKKLFVTVFIVNCFYQTEEAHTDSQIPVWYGMSVCHSSCIEHIIIRFPQFKKNALIEGNSCKITREKF